MTGRRWAAIWLVALVGASAVVEMFFSARATEPDVSRMLQGPTWEHWFGTDSLGRDLLARLLKGTRGSLTVGLGGAIVSLALGVFGGMIAGWFGGWADRLLMRGTDVLLSVPTFVLVAVLSLGLQQSLPFDEGTARTLMALVLALGLTHWMNVARVTRSLVRGAKVFPFVEAARALGASDATLVRRHILPGLIPHLVVLLGLQVPSNILYESFMSFIGVGLQPPDTSWGLLVQEGWRSLSNAPHLMFFPSAVLFLTIWSLHAELEIVREGSDFEKTSKVSKL